MNSFLNYWSQAFVSSSKRFAKYTRIVLCVEEPSYEDDNFLEVFIDHRDGETKNAIFLYKAPGYGGSFASAEEANMIQGFFNA